MRNYFGEDQKIRFLFPIDGDCINSNDGRGSGDCIRIPVRVEAPQGHAVEVNGIAARYETGCYRTYADVASGEVTLEARDLSDGTVQSIKVFRLPDVMGGYRLSSDDNIIFLWDINEHRDEYKSIFENPYLAVYKKAHDLYGAKVHINLFYEFDEEARACFSKERPYFNLSMMTDRFKDEFRANSDWLKLSFHAQSEFPPAPYRHADYETVRRDCERVHAEIRRFAGEETLSKCTTVHFGEANEEGARALYDLGYRALTGYFIPDEFSVAYYAKGALLEHIYERDFWYDTEIGVLFGRIDLVLNCNTHRENLETIREIMASPTRGGFVSVMIHEQYFYSDYMNHRPDFEARVLEACKLIAESGYVGKHITKVFLSLKHYCCKIAR